jgi:hypothetical protein
MLTRSPHSSASGQFDHMVKVIFARAPRAVPIAEVSIRAGGMLVVTGKGYGRTNIIVLDRGDNVLVEKVVQVQGPGDNS